MKKNCQECGQPLSGRSDKRFCDDACRAQFHHKNQAPDEALKQINRILKRNYQILDQLLKQSNTKTHVVPLMQMHFLGFSSCFFTHIDPNLPNTFFCYDICFSNDTNGMVKIYRAPYSFMQSTNFAA